MILNSGNGQSDDEALSLTDLSLSTLMIFITLTLVILVQSHMKRDPKTIGHLKKIHDSKASLEELKVEFDDIRLKKMRQEAQLRHDFREGKVSHVQQLPAESIERLAHERLRKVLNHEGETLGQTTTLDKIREQLSQRVSTLISEHKSNRYKSDQEKVSIMQLKFMKFKGILKVFFGKDGSHPFSISEFTRILEVIQRGDGIRIEAPSYSKLSLVDKMKVDDAFERAGWPHHFLELQGNGDDVDVFKWRYTP